MDTEQTDPANSDPVASAKTMLADAGQTLGKEASDLASTAKAKAAESFSEKKESATQSIGAFADAIRKAGDDLAEHDQSAVGQVVKQAADGLASLSRSVSEKSPEDLLRTVREFGRANPVAFIAGSVLVGVALGRFARSSAGHAARSAGTGGQGEPRPGAVAADIPGNASYAFTSPPAMSASDEFDGGGAPAYVASSGGA